MIYVRELASDKDARRLRYEARKGNNRKAARQASRLLRKASQSDH